MKKTEVLRDTGIIVTIWGTLLIVLFATPVLGVPTKIELAHFIRIAAAIAFPLYFMTDQVRRRRSFLIQVGIALIVINLLAWMGFTLDQVVYLTWQWVQFNGIYVVTWINMLDTSLFSFSIILYYWAAKTTWLSIPEWRQEWEKSSRRRKSKKQVSAKV